MRKYLPALLTLSLVVAPGCMLAIGNGPDDGSGGGKMKQLEQRVSALEHKMADCCGDCCEMDDDDHAEHEHGGPGGPGMPPPPPMHPPGQSDPH